MPEKLSLIEKLRHARRVSVPLVAVSTADPKATIVSIAKEINGGPVVCWDCVRGVWPVNEAGEDVARKFKDGDQDITVGDPEMYLRVLEGLKPPAIKPGLMAFALNLDQYLVGERLNKGVMQGVWNLRDAFKQDGRILIALAPSFSLPPALHDDVIVLDEELPGADQLGEIVRYLDASANVCGKCRGTGQDKGLRCEPCAGSGKRKRKAMSPDTVQVAVEATLGLSAFAAEQAVAMALRPGGKDQGGKEQPTIDLDHLWATKVGIIEQTRGLSVYRGGEKFGDLGGLDQIKQYLLDVMRGKKPPAAVVWIDEIEKTGLAARGDTSGVNADQEGTLLSFMEDFDVFGVMLLGVPGCGKSALCKAVGAECERLVLRVDLGAMQGSLVGESQQMLRGALKVVSAVGGKDALWLATSNSVSGLSGAMRSRFTDSFFFDLPSEKERTPIWKVWLKKYGLTKPADPLDDEGWVGRNIRRCCHKAWQMNLPVTEAARYIIPVGISEASEIRSLREGASGKYLSASHPGVYQVPRSAGERSLSL